MINDFDNSELQIDVARVDADRLARAVERFKQQQSAGAFPGGQIAVRRYGELVINVAVGLGRGLKSDEPRAASPVLPQTPFPAYSCGKPLAATAIAMLEDRGKLDPNAPVADVFPEFSCNGKAQVTTLDVLTHRSGILLPHSLTMMERWGDRDAMTREVANAVPIYPRGTLAYAPWEYGWILSEVVRRVDGRDLASFFAEEIAMPLGLPALNFGFGDRDPISVAHSYWLGKEKLMIAGVNVARDFERIQNHKLYFDSLNPACTLITDADSLAMFYDFVLKDGITASGKRLISERALRQYTNRSVFGYDRSLRTFLALGRGFSVGTLPPSMFGWWNTKHCFGHAGSFSCAAGADYETGVSFAILTNGNRSIPDFTRRFVPLIHMIRKACRA